MFYPKSYLNPKEEDSSYKIDKFMATKMGVAGLVFEPHPPNFEIFTTFKDVQMMLKQFFDISTGFRFKKMQ